MRTDDGEILNERQYILPPTPVTELFLGMGNLTEDGFAKCNLSEWGSANIVGDHYSPTQVIVAGTRNPFAYGETGERIKSLPEKLQYGNGICGVDSMSISIDIIKEENRRFIKPTVKLVKFGKESAEGLADEIQMNATSVSTG